METAVGGRNIGCSTPKVQTCISSVKEERQEECAVMPHQQHLMPVRQTSDEQIFRHTAHLGQAPFNSTLVLSYYSSFREEHIRLMKEPLGWSIKDCVVSKFYKGGESNGAFP